MRRALLLRLFMLSLFLLAACQSMQPTAVSLGLSAMPNPFDDTKAAQAHETYYGLFDDVPLPRDMKIDASKTYHSKNDPARTGFLLLTGNVELTSLLTAQALTLTRDGWTVTAFFRGPTSMLTARKGERVCVVTMGESMTVTWMMIWVAPRSEGFRTPLSRYATPEEIARAAKKQGGTGQGGGGQAAPAINTAPAAPVSSTGASVQESALTD